ncbi:MAG TPA: peptide deformylase [Ruminococcus sp.]|nr:peptide deformylase [Ruminococcus sp.]
MICPICRDTVLLSKPAEDANKADMHVVQNLKDTLAANAEQCVGMAANMIGVPKRIIAILLPGTSIPMLMINPRILTRSAPYETEEGCLSLPGVRKVTRYRVISVEWQNIGMQKQKRKFEGYPAQIIQHELDHCNGILV